ncbi:MAG: FHA domain-containing protein [Verrucomicrobiota bacterium]
MFKLHVEQGEQKGETFALQEGENLAGRSHKVHIRLSEPDVSSLQAKITLQGGKVTVANLSRHGTWVNDEKLAETESALLEVGQTIRVGQSLVLRLKPDSEAAMESSPGGDLPGSSRAGSASASGAASADKETTHSKPGPGAPPRPEEGIPVSAPVTGDSTEFERQMRAKAEATQLEEPAGESASDATVAQQTVFIPEAELNRRLLAERKKPRQRLALVLGATVISLVLLLVLKPKQVAEGKLEWDNTYAAATEPVPRGGYKLIYPKNETTKLETAADGLTVVTRLGRKRDIPLILSLHEYADDKWAAQKSEKTVEDWMKGCADRVFGNLSYRFEGEQSGIRVWTASYTREEKGVKVGQVTAFCHGRRLEVLSAEIPGADQARAENFLLEYSYFDFPPEFEAGHWEGRPPVSNLSPGTLFKQIRTDLGREAPLTWASIGNQLGMILSWAAVEKRVAEEQEAQRLLAGLHEQEARWYNSQQLQVNNATRARDEKQVSAVAQRCQAVFSDEADRRYFEVRRW